jgi:hypothetical protein
MIVTALVEIAIGLRGLVFEQHEEFRYRLCATDAFFILAHRGGLLE